MHVCHSELKCFYKVRRNSGILSTKASAASNRSSVASENLLVVRASCVTAQMSYGRWVDANGWEVYYWKEGKDSRLTPCFTEQRVIPNLS